MRGNAFARLILALGLCLFVVVGSATAATWDASADYSITNGNPNGVWTYGFCPADISGGSAGFSAYTNNGLASGKPLLFWFNDASNPEGIADGLITYNPNSTEFSAGWALFPAHYLGYHPGMESERPTVRWTSPIAGTISISVVAKGSYSSTSTDQHLFVDNTQVWTDTIWGNSPAEVSTVKVADVTIGSTVDFVGGDGGNYIPNDGTVFTMVIQSVEIGQISGIVTSNLPGNPVLPGVTVSVDGIETTTTDENGAYSFSGVVAADHTLTFTKARYATLTHVVTVPANGTATYSPTLETARLSGTVTSSAAGNPPVAAVRVSLTGTDVEAVTDSAGHYQLDAVPGTYTVNFTKSGYETASVSQAIAAGDATTLNQQLTFTSEIWDAGYDFQSLQNPAGVWSYGSLDLSGTEFTPYTTGYFADATAPLIRWDADQVTATRGFVAKNFSDEEYDEYQTGQVVGYYPPMPSALPHTLGVQPGQTGDKAAVRWQAPRTGVALIHARFSGITGDAAIHNTRTDCHVYVNGLPIYDADVDGFTGTYANNYADGHGLVPVVDRWLTCRVNANDTIDFAVGFGNDAHYENDLTGLVATVQMTETAPGDVVGTVRSSAPGNPPIEGAKVATEDGRFWTLTDYEGSYYLVIPSGENVKLVASKTAYASEEKAVNLPADGYANCDFTLSNGRVSGIITDSATHLPLNGATIQTQDGAYSTYSELDGSYNLDIAPGNYVFHVFLPGYVKLTPSVSVTGVVTENFALTLDPDFNADLKADFSLGYNPNGFWTYGYYYVGDFTPYEPYTGQAYQIGIPGVILGLGDISATIGVILKNFSSEPVIFAGHVPPGGIAFHPGAQNQMPTARWTAPSNAKVVVTATFDDGSYPTEPYGATSDGYVMKNGEVIGHGYLEHYQGIYSWTFTGLVDVLQGDNLDFALGYGSNGRYHSDLTIVNVTVARAAPPQEISSIGDLNDPALIGKYVKLTDKAAICDGTTFTDGFFIEETGRTAGIKVVGSPDPATVLNGDRVTVTGILAGELGALYIQADSVTRVAGPALGPVGTANRSLPTTSGLLAKVWGNVTFVDTTSNDYFYVNDGSGLTDGSGQVGVRVDISKLTSPDETRGVISGLSIGQSVSVTGVVGIESGRLTVRPRGSSDIND